MCAGTDSLGWLYMHIVYMFHNKQRNRDRYSVALLYSPSQTQTQSKECFSGSTIDDPHRWIEAKQAAFYSTGFNLTIFGAFSTLTKRKCDVSSHFVNLGSSAQKTKRLYMHDRVYKQIP